MSDIKFTIDGKECTAKSGQTIVEAATDNKVYIPVLCTFKGLKPAGTCRICTVKVGGRFQAGCTTPVTNGMVVENKTTELEDFRKALVEMLFVEGNHFCPACEKSGSCELQALGYRYLMMVPRFPFSFPRHAVDGSAPNMIYEPNRCVQCLRCVRGVTTSDKKHVFGLVNRGDHTAVKPDAELAAKLSDAETQKAMDMCPVGAILKKEVGFSTPIGKRKYDSTPIGSDIER